MTYNDDVLKALSDIKALLVLIAYKSGVKQDEIGKCLGINNTRVSQIISGLGKKNKSGSNEK